MTDPIIFDIQRGSYVDGPGIRTTVFFKGCNLRCVWCHNPESQMAAPQLLFHARRCVGCGKCRKKCPNGMENCTLCGQCALWCPQDARELCGKTHTTDEVLAEIRKDKGLYAASGGGVTFSGGECMLQIEPLAALLQQCREEGIHTAVDTAGHVPHASFERILPYTDLFLYDVKCLDSEKHKKYVGVGNERILANLQGLLTAGASVLIRIPIVPTVNDTVEEMEGIKALLKSFAAPVTGVELLPYHAMGEHKYEALGRVATSFAAPTAEKMAELRRVFA